MPDDVIDPRDLIALRMLVGRRFGPKSLVALPSGRLVSGEEAEEMCAAISADNGEGATDV
jgi:hypothetical protein